MDLVLEVAALGIRTACHVLDRGQRPCQSAVVHGLSLELVRDFVDAWLAW